MTRNKYHLGRYFVLESMPNFPFNTKKIRLLMLSKRARSYYKVNQSFLVDLFFIGFMIKVAGVGRSRPWDTDPDRNTVHPLLIETCLRLVGTQIPYNKRSYDTISDKEANRQIY